MKRNIIDLLISSLFVLSIVSCISNKDRNAELEQVDENPCELVFGICVDSLHMNEFKIERGDYLSSILNRIGFTSTESEKIANAVSPFYPPSKLRVGNRYIVFTDVSSKVKYVVFQKTLVDYAVIDLNDGNINVYEYAKPVTLKRQYTEANITSSMWNAIMDSGAPAMLALKLQDLYAWQVDFFDIKMGDSFRLMYDVAYVDDTTMVEISSIEGAVFSHQGKKYRAIPFQQDSISEFFDEEGNSLRKAFLKAPLDYIRITSKFTNSRFHPILKRSRPHHGVDYAAPVGTPVLTIGDGIVIEKGFQRGGAGNFLKIKHNGSYVTTYMHLSRFAKGIEKGRSVKQGDVIAYVGSTGLSTGPHLDFRVHKNNQPVNPLTVESPPCLPVRPELTDSFRVVRERVLYQLDSLRIIEQMLANQQSDSIKYQPPRST